MKPQLIMWFLVSFLWGTAWGQNVGIGTNSPEEKLEVAGKIFSNLGGIKFPDHTVQTTAAYNQNTPEEASQPRGIALIYFENIPGDLDTLGQFDVSLVYDWQVSMIRNTGAAQYIDFLITKQINRATIHLLNRLVTNTTIQMVHIYLTREMTPGIPEIYCEIELTGVKVSGLSPHVTPQQADQYSHLEVLKLLPTTIRFEDIQSGQSFCWDFVTNGPC